MLYKEARLNDGIARGQAGSRWRTSRCATGPACRWRWMACASSPGDIVILLSTRSLTVIS